MMLKINFSKLVYFLPFCLLVIVGFLRCSTVGLQITDNARTISINVTDVDGTIIFQNNGADDLEVDKDGVYTFSSPGFDSQSYDISVLKQDAEHYFQKCNLSQASGLIDGKNIMLDIDCPDPVMVGNPKNISYSWFSSMLFNDDLSFILPGYQSINFYSQQGQLQKRIDLPNKETAGGLNIVQDTNGNYYVSDEGNHQIHKYDQNFNHLLSFGGLGSSSGQLNRPSMMFISDANQLYVSEIDNHRVSVFDLNGTFIRSIGTGIAGNADGQFNRPLGIVVLADGTTYVVDRENARVQVFDENGVFLSKFGSSGSGVNQFNRPAGMYLEGSELIIVDTYNRRVVSYNLAGVQNSVPFDGTGTEINWDRPLVMAQASNGHRYIMSGAANTLYITDSNWNYLSSISALGSTDTTFHFSNQVAISPLNNNVLVNDEYNHQVKIYDDQLNYIQTLGKTDASIGTADGEFNRPCGLAVDTNGDIYVSDHLNQRVQVFNHTGLHLRNIVSQDGTAGSDPGDLLYPCGLTFKDDNVYITNHYGSRRISVFSKLGVFVTDIGGATADPMGNFDNLHDVAIDGDGDMYAIDHSRTRKLDSAGNFISRIADGVVFGGGYTALALNSNDKHIYITDWTNFNIAVVDSSGNVVDTIGERGIDPGQFNEPAGIAFSADHSVMAVSEYGHGRVQLFELDDAGKYQPMYR